MFFVNDTQSQRHRKIRSFLQREPFIGVLLGAADFEWTCRRAVIALGQSPNVEIHEALGSCHGLDAYKGIWKDEVQPVHEAPLATIVPNWNFFKKKAFPLRHKIIHGALGSVQTEYASERVECILDASQALCEFAVSRDRDIYKRLPVRQRKK